MPIEAKPLFRPDVLRTHLAAFELPAHIDAFRPKLKHWADLLASDKANSFKEQEILPDFLADFFCELLGYSRPADGGPRYTISREKYVQVEGEFADAVLGDFGRGPDKFIVALEGKGPKDPLDRPFSGRRLSAVEQGYRYAINLPCDWIIVTSVRQTRLYCKGCDQQTYERFDTEQLADDDALLKRFVFLLGAERVIPESGPMPFLRVAGRIRAGRKGLDQGRIRAQLRCIAARLLRIGSILLRVPDGRFAVADRALCVGHVLGQIVHLGSPARRSIRLQTFDSVARRHLRRLRAGSVLCCNRHRC